jgi:hypothetical protein
MQAMGKTMSTEHKTKQESTELVSHYRPLGLKAVAAACAVKGERKKPVHVEQDIEAFGHLPEGFHMPQELDG